MQQGTDDGGSSPAATGATGTATTNKAHVNGGRFDFDDGGTYCGGWEEGKAHGHGVCTGPKGQGAYSGSWHYGFEVSGVYTWPSGSAYEGQWQNGKRHGIGVETRGRWIYRGEWTQGFKGRYGVRQSNTSTAKYEGTWANGLQDGYGSETYADEGTYQGQWLRGMRHGYGVRKSAPFGKASKYRTNKALRASMTSLRSNEGASGAAPEVTDKRDKRVDDSRGGFVLKVNSNEPTTRRRSLGPTNIKIGILSGLKIKKQKSTSDLDKRGVSGSMRSTASTTSWISTDSAQSAMTNASLPSDSNASFVVEDDQMDPSVTETYYGEWKNDKRTGYGVSERSDGLMYEGEWYNNKKYGYGVTTFSNGEKEEGKYKNNVLITNPKKKHLFLMRSAKFRERIDGAVNAAQRAYKIALQKADIAITRTSTARGKAEQADLFAAQAREDSEVALAVAKQYAPDFKQPGLERLRAKERQKYAEYNQVQKEPVINSSTNPNTNVNQNKPIITNQIQIPNQKSNEMPNNIYGSQNKLANPVPMPRRGSFRPAEASNVYNNPNPTSIQVNSEPVVDNHHHKTNDETLEINANNLQQQLQAQLQSLKESTPMRGRNSLTTTTDQNSMMRRGSRVKDRPYLGSTSQQSSIDHFDHYKRPPSRDSSVDRYSRATVRMGGNVPGGMGSRQASVDRTVRPSVTPDRNIRAPSMARGTTPAPPSNNTRNGSVVSANMNLNSNPVKASPAVGGNGVSPPAGSPPFEEILIKKRTLGQDIIPSPSQPKRTESLFIPGGNVVAPKNDEDDEEDLMCSPALMARRASESWINTPPLEPVAPLPTTLSRKKSLPDFQELPRATGPMSREEVSTLGSARREEVRRQIEENEKLRANPLLYLVSPQVKDWFSRQQLVIVILFVNISLAIMFFKLLT